MGAGRSATKVKDEDFIDKLFVANSHDTLLCFSSRGKVYWLKVYQVPRASRGARGKPIINLLPLQEGERINAVLPVREYDRQQICVHGDQQGSGQEDFARGVLASAHQRHYRGGSADGDKLVDVALTNGAADIFLAASSGKAISFNEKDVREMGRGAAGVKGIQP